ncbi:diacylglycerol acyltransferase [Dunaliella salina]|uniref:Diacylglycerol acyltransferase n=1 Tax=Dunaliella salina TaxID=3046 RepID=A0ABQ7GYW9_DUNSA|nr:diacylglycerol acyltransferase [Dunaliella salina]|eukprot:KAF5839777.1 diacylglycerol acyltransferase [Dunaliella salina]
MAWIGCLPASRSNFLHLIKRGTVGVIVGGIAEMFMVDSKRERVKLVGRKGFVRVALEAGVDLVPVYYFGQSQVFCNYGPPFLARLSRKWRVAMGVLVGRFFLPMPRPIPIYLVHGKPIPVTQISPSDPGFEKAVDELHVKAVEAIKDLYMRHREEYGWPNRPLSIE